MKVASREYKVIIDGQLLADVASGLDRLLEDIARIGKGCGIAVKGAFDADDSRKQFLRFLDTRDHALKANDLLLRQRVRRKSGKTKYTLRCRSGDRYIVAETNVDSAKSFGGEQKLEEDIAPPFVSRLSHSTTGEVGKKWGASSLPTTLAEAGEMFPGVLEVRRNGRTCSPKSKLFPVAELPVFEQVFEGPKLKMPGQGRIGPVAVILWTRGERGTVLTAELSFRHEKVKRKRIGEIAPVTKRFFEELQRQKWARPAAIGKTEFMYQQK